MISKFFRFMCFSLLFLMLHTVALAQMIYKGETYRSKEVITQLDVDDLEAGAVYEFFFEGTPNQLGHYWYIPVTVIKGQREGSKFLINSGIHGNELNSMLTTYKVKEQLNVENVIGTVTIVHGLNVSGLQKNTRGFNFGGNSEWTTDLNRLMDQGKNTTAAEQFATLVWEKLLAQNADMAIDLHTSGKSSSLPLFVYADYRAPNVRRMAELAGADVIKMDSGATGTIETTFVQKGIPAITYELGSAETREMDIIERASLGVMNILLNFDYISGEDLFFAKWAGDAFVGNDWISMKALRGGFIENLFELNDFINEDEVVFIQYDPLGNPVEEYKAPVTGVLTWLNTHPYGESGQDMGEIIFYNPSDEQQILEERILTQVLPAQNTPTTEDLN